MLNDDGHVTIDGVSYVLAEDEEPHYNHRFESLFSPTQAIAGEIAKEQIRPEKLLWSWTDWSGGEGGRIYYPQDSTRYDFGTLVNGTIPGQLTTRPRRRRSAVARAGANADTGSLSAGGSTYTSALIGWEDNIVRSTNATSWAAAQDTTPDKSGTNFSGAVSDGLNIAFIAVEPNLQDAVPVVDGDASLTTWTDTHTGTGILAAATAAVLDGVPYTWAVSGAGTQTSLFKKSTNMNTASDWGATTIFTLDQAQPGTIWGTNYWTGIVSAETSLFFFWSSRTQSYVWECRNDVVRPYWTPPPGIIIKKLIYTDGILFAIGNQHAAGKNFAFIRAIPLSTRTPILVAQPRKHTNTELTNFSVGCAGPNSEIYAADAVSGKIFVYDIRHDALHLFDDLTNGGAGDGMSYGANERVAFLAMHGNMLFGATWTSGGAGTSLQVFSYEDMEPANRDASQAVSANVISPQWDFGVPMELKALIGFYVTYQVVTPGNISGLATNSRIIISYSIDDAAYVDLAVIDKDTTPSGQQGRVFQQVSTGDTTVKFSRMKMKITLDNNSAAAAPPVVFGVTAEAQLMAYAETWDLAVRVEDEDSNEGPTSRQNSGSFLRDHLESLAVNKNVVTFRDGYRYKQNATYTEHTVVVEDPADTIVTNGEGVMRIKLRAIL